MARTGTLEQGARGVSAFYVDLNAPGVSRTRFRDLGSRAVGRGSIFFDSVRVPADARIGAEGAGFVQVMQGFDFSRAMIGLMCIGAAQQSVDETCAYVNGAAGIRRQPRALRGRVFPTRRGCGETAGRPPPLLRSAMEKGPQRTARMDFGGREVAGSGTLRAGDPSMLLLHGHLGFSLDLPHQQRMRDVIGLEIGDGTAQIMKSLVAREIIGKDARPY